jgi:hypothetical protein
LGNHPCRHEKRIVMLERAGDDGDHTSLVPLESDQSTRVED